MEWKKGNFNRVLFIFFILYVSALTWIVLFKLTVPSNIVSLSRDRVINVIPFFEVITGEYFDTFDMIANIIAFIPFGYIYSFSSKRNTSSFETYICSSFKYSLRNRTICFCYRSMWYNRCYDEYIGSIYRNLGLWVYKLQNQNRV